MFDFIIVLGSFIDIIYTEVNVSIIPRQLTPKKSVFYKTTEGSWLWQVILDLCIIVELE